MSRAPRPEHGAPITIEILNFRDYVGESRGQRFIKMPDYFFTERELDLPGDLLRFFFRLVRLSAHQRVPGALRSSAVGLSRECRCHPESVLTYLPRLIEIQLIRELSAAAAPRGEEIRIEKKREEAAFSLPGASPDTWRKIFADLPPITRFQLGLDGVAFEAAMERANSPDHVVSDEIYAEIASTFPGESQGYSIFGTSYCRLFLQNERAVLFMLNCIQEFRKRGWDWESNAPRKGRPATIQKWLYSAWWDWLYDGKAGKYLEFLIYKGKNHTVTRWLHNISDQSQQVLVINKFDGISTAVSPTSHPDDHPTLSGGEIAARIAGLKASLGVPKRVQDRANS